MDLDHVPGGAGDRRDDGDIAPGKGVEQGRLAGIGRAGEHDGEALAQALAAAVGGGATDLVRDPVDRGEDLRLQILRHIALVGEVEARLEQGQHLQHLLAPTLGGMSQLAAELAHGLAPLRLGLGIDEVGEALDLGEVHAAVEKGAAGELAGLRRAAILDGAERAQHRGPGRQPAMDMELGLILAGKALRPRHPQDEGLIERLAARRIRQGPHDGPAGIGHASRHPLEDSAALPTADPDQADGGAAVTGGHREDRVVRTHEREPREEKRI